MPRPRQGTAHAITAIAILALFAFLAFALVRLFQVEREMRGNVSENMLWVITQAQVASHRLDEAVNRRVLGNTEATPQLNFDILTSRLVLLDEGPQRRYLEALGLGGWLEAAFSRLNAIETLLASVEPGATRAAGQIHAQLDPLSTKLNRIANRVMVQEWEDSGQRLDKLRDSLVQVIASVVGIMVSSLLLALLLLIALRERLETQRLERSLAQEKEVSDFYRSFAAMVSHQFRTPLAVIDSGLQRLIRRDAGMGDNERRERYNRLREAVARLTRLVESSLTAARLDGGRVQASLECQDLVPVVRQACRLQEEASGEKRVHLQLPEQALFARCDRALVEQILANLLSNAFKYSSRDPVAVTLLGEPAGEVQCRISDRGIGIRREDCPHLFERYFRSPDAASISGIGLGLYISRHLARLQGGDVTLQLPQGDGTCFLLTLPGTTGDDRDREAD